MTKIKTAIAIAVGTLFAGAAFAQSNYSIEQRDLNEQARIDRGIDSGQLTSREASRLQGERAQVERIERRARADGVLTQYERARIDRAQDRLGRDIFRESHDRQTTDSNWRTSDRPQGWDRRDGAGQRNFDRGVRSEQFNRRDAFRGERNDSRTNGNDGRFGRSDLNLGGQSHFQQTSTQGSHDQQGQTQRSWNRPAHTSTPAASPATTTNPATTASPAAPQGQTQRSWNRPARTSSPTTAATPAASPAQAQTQRSWTRPAQATRVSTAASTTVAARQGGYSGRHTR